LISAAPMSSVGTTIMTVIGLAAGAAEKDAREERPDWRAAMGVTIVGLSRAE
jgi:hypothetical protein